MSTPNGATVIWNRERECASHEAMSALQIKRLLSQLDYVQNHSPFYRELWARNGVSPDDIHGLDDLAALPFTTKQDFREQYPFGMLAVSMDEIVRVHGSSGTTGKPTVVAYTAADIELWREVMARTLACGGVTHHDVVHNAYGYGLFTGGLGAHYGAERVGATVIPMSGGNTQRQIMLLQDFKATALCCTPSYALYLHEAAQELGVDFRDLPLRVGFFGAEPWTQAMREQIEERLGIVALDISGLSEIIGPGVSAECLERNGLHINADHFYPEVVDPDSGDPLPDGEYGELVFTTLTKQGLPVIRYRTGDITRLMPDPCPCGRTTVRMEKISGRTDDMIIVRGVNVFPSQIESVLLRVEGVQPHYVILLDREAGSMDTLEVWVEMSQDIFADRLGILADLTSAAEHEIRETLGIQARVKLVEPGTIERSMGKARRVIDRRELYGN